MKSKKEIKERIEYLRNEITWENRGNSLMIHDKINELEWVLKSGQTISCDRCHGEGFMEEAGMTKCHKCGGEGVIYVK